MSDKPDIFGDAAAVPLTPGMTMAERRRVLKERVQHHVDHLDALAQTLKNDGADDATITGRVSTIFEQYKAQLLRNIDLTGRAFDGQKNTAANSPQEKPDTSSNGGSQ
jgi:hypothetical protein